MQTGVDIARGGAARRAVELLAEKAEELRGINKENAVKAMEELLEEAGELVLLEATDLRNIWVQILVDLVVQG
jgi:hypothetical protein